VSTTVLVATIVSKTDQNPCSEMSRITTYLRFTVMVATIQRRLEIQNVSLIELQIQIATAISMNGTALQTLALKPVLL
jgi:hypothetical protein